MLSAATAGSAAEHTSPVAGRHCVAGAEAAPIQGRRGDTARGGAGSFQLDRALGDPTKSGGCGPTRRAPDNRDC